MDQIPSITTDGIAIAVIITVLASLPLIATRIARALRKARKPATRRPTSVRKGGRHE